MDLEESRWEHGWNERLGGWVGGTLRGVQQGGWTGRKQERSEIRSKADWGGE
jgi:hypothetical protein